MTELCELFRKYGSDKALGGNPTRRNHNYSELYHKLFNDKRDKINSVFELGIGRCANGIPGPSLRAWRDYFPNAAVYGADIKADILFQDDRIFTYQCNQENVRQLQHVFKDIGISGYDIIIEDGKHTAWSSFIFTVVASDYLKPDGTFIIEDVHPKYEKDLINLLRNAGIDHEFFRMEHKGRKRDNNLIILK